VPDDACWRDLSLRIGQLTGEMKVLALLDKKMDDCIDVCQSGHNRITRCEEKNKVYEKNIANHEDRIKSLEESMPFIADKKLLGAIVIGSAALGSAIFEVLKATDFLKILLGH
jgi:hypothetical protein